MAGFGRLLTIEPHQLHVSECPLLAESSHSAAKLMSSRFLPKAVAY
jgi:hypothetical protein